MNAKLQRLQFENDSLRQQLAEKDRIIETLRNGDEYYSRFFENEYAKEHKAFVLSLAYYDENQQKQKHKTTIFSPSIPITDRDSRLGNETRSQQMCGVLGTFFGAVVLPHQPPLPNNDIAPTRIIDLEVLAASGSNPSLLLCLLHGISTGNIAVPTVNQMMDRETRQRRPILLSYMAENMLHIALRNGYNGSLPVPPLQHYFTNLLSAYKSIVPSRVGIALTLTGMTQNLHDSYTLKEVEAVAHLFRLYNNIPKNSIQLMVTDNCHFRTWDGSVADYSGEFSRFVTPYEAQKLGLYDSSVLDGHRPVEDKDWFNAFPNENDVYNVTLDDVIVKDELARDSWQDSIQGLHSLKETYNTQFDDVLARIMQCQIGSDYDKIAKEMASKQVSVNACALGRVNGKDDKFTVILPEKYEEAWKTPSKNINNLQQILEHNRIDHTDLIFNTLSSRHGCSRFLRAHLAEMGQGGSDIEEFVNIQSSNLAIDFTGRLGTTANGLDSIPSVSSNSGAEIGNNTSGTNNTSDTTTSSSSGNNNNSSNRSNSTSNTNSFKNTNKTSSNSTSSKKSTTQHAAFDLNTATPAEIAKEHDLGRTVALVDGSPASVFDSFFNYDGQNRTHKYDKGNFRHNPGSFHEEKAGQKCISRHCEPFVHALIKPWRATLRTIAHYDHGTDNRQRQREEQRYAAGVRLGISLMYIKHLEALNPQDSNQKLKNIHWKDVHEYALQRAERCPALFMVLEWLTFTSISCAQRVSGKKGDHSMERQLCRLIRPLYSITNAFKYVSLSVAKEVTFRTSSKYDRVLHRYCYYVCFTSNGYFIVVDLFQEKCIFLIRSVSGSHAKMHTINVRKHARHNVINLKSILETKSNANVTMGNQKEQNVQNVQQEDEQYAGERIDNEEEEKEDRTPVDILRNEPMSKEVIRGMQVGMTLFSCIDDNVTDLKGKQIPPGKWVSPADATEKLNPDWIVSLATAKHRLQKFVRDYWLVTSKDIQQEAADAKEGEGNDRYARRFKRRKKNDSTTSSSSSSSSRVNEDEEGHSFSSKRGYLWNNRFTRRDGIKNGTFKWIPCTENSLMVLRKLRDERLTTKSASLMETHSAGGERLFTHDEVITELLNLRQEHLEDEYDVYLQSLIKGSDVEFEKLAKSKGKGKRWACNILEKIRTEKVDMGPSEKLVLSIKSQTSASIESDGSITFNGETFDPFDTWVIQNNLPRLGTDVTLDFTTTVPTSEVLAGSAGSGLAAVVNNNSDWGFN
tara:strand:+ start:209 stop:3946 length:3738 start_codon:yes stop_codon:yes gene_type:complete